MSEDATRYRTVDGSSLTPSEIARLDAAQAALGVKGDRTT
jgi:hypothetical protein